MSTDSGQKNRPVGSSTGDVSSQNGPSPKLPSIPKIPKATPSPAPAPSPARPPAIERTEVSAVTAESQEDDPYRLRGVRGSLIGRDAELGRMLEFAESGLRSGGCGRITVVGNQGTGKSRLVVELLRKLPKEFRVFQCKAVPDKRRFNTVARVLRARFGLLEGSPPEEASQRVRREVRDVFGDKNSSEVLHVLGRFLDLDFPDSPFLQVLGENPSQYENIAKAVLCRFFEMDSKQGAFLLVIDDLQWADPSSLSLLWEVGQALSAVPALMVVCSHPDLLVSSPQWGGESTSTIQISLRNLSDKDAESMFREMLARCAQLPDDIVEDAVEMTGGNPHFLDQLTRLYLSNGTVDTSGVIWRLDPDKAMDTDLPVTVEQVIEARISSLAFDERTLLEMGAVFGNVFWLGAVVALRRLETDSEGESEAREAAVTLEYSWQEPGEEIRRAVCEGLGRLVERDYLLRLDTEDSMVSGDVEFVFKHNLERELIAKGTERVRLRRYHRLAAQWIETTNMASSDDQLEFLGQLYERGGDNRRAARAYICGGDRARARFANEQAAQLYRQGLALLDEDEVVILLDALHNMGAVVDMSGDTKQAQLIFSKMLHHAWLLDYRSKGGAAHNRLGRIHRRLGEYDLAMDHLRSAQELFKAVDDKRGIAGTLDDIGQVHWLRGAYGQALSFHRQALAIRRGIGDLRSIALSLANIGRVHHETGSFKAASRQFAEALKIRREIEDQAGVVQSLCDIGRVEAADRNAENGQNRFLEAKAIALKIGDRLALTEIFAGLSECQAALGNDSDAIGSLLEGKSIAHTLGNRPATSDCYRRLAEIYLSGGDVSQAGECAKRALSIGIEVGARLHIGRAHRVMAELVFSQGRTNEALEDSDKHYRKSVDILAGIKSELELARTYRSYAVLREHAGSSEEADKLRRRSDEIFSRLHGANRQEDEEEGVGVRLGTASDAEQ
ncbi:MAG: tetratricopeptide repeat protein [Kofleriaceae bacterium]|nr:tetratricopeptide repeat protein [Kofleriaceae bacterium]